MLVKEVKFLLMVAFITLTCLLWMVNGCTNLIINEYKEYKAAIIYDCYGK